MDYSIQLRPLATLEIVEAYDWYQAQREGLGEEFLEELDQFYQRLQQNPFAYSFYDAPIRQGKLDRFPYVIVYEVFEPVIVVYSVFMTRQDPDTKKKRII